MQKPSVVVRPAREEDLPALRVLAQAFGREQVESSGWGRLGRQFETLVGETLQIAVKSSHGLVLAARDGEAAVGYLMAQAVEPAPLFVPDPYLFISDLYVRPDYRRQGIGRELLEQARMWGFTKGLRRISIVALEGTSGVVFARAAGFAPMQHLMVWQDPEAPDYAEDED